MATKTTPVFGIRYPDKDEKPLVAQLEVIAKDSDAALDLIVPPGTMHPYAGNAAPTGFLLCDGSAVSRTTYARLFTAIGTKFGVGNGTTTFNVPDARGRVLVSVDGAAGRLTEKDALGESGGTEKHVLTTAQLASHKHADGTLTVAAHSHSDGTLKAAKHSHTFAVSISLFNEVGAGNGARRGGGLGFEAFTLNAGPTGETEPDVTGETGSASPDVTGESASAGSGEAHPNMPPYLVVNHIIRV